MRKYMQRQTLQPVEWHVFNVADWRDEPIQHFLHNMRLLCKLELKGDIIAVVENDDAYLPDHLKQSVSWLLEDGHDMVGSVWQRYYHVGQRVHKTFRNRGSCLCQTVFRRELLPVLRECIEDAIQTSNRGLDALFWSRCETLPDVSQGVYEGVGHVVGIKGMPGEPGLGIGHKPRPNWEADPDLTKLAQWVGQEDAQRYARFWSGSDE
jgi:hypothetical protein